MRTVLRAVDEPQAQRADSWRETVSTAFAGLDIELERAPDEHDQIVIGQAGPAQFIESRSGPGRARRTAAHIRSNDPDRYVLFVQAEGASVGEQLGRRTEYGRGDLGLLDLSLPLRCEYTARHAVMVSYPKALCPFGEAELAPLFGTGLGGATGTPALIAGLVRELPRHLTNEDEVASARVGTALLDLVHVGVASRLGRPEAVAPDGHRRALHSRCLAFIEEHLADPDLSPAAVAAAHHISLRQLHRLFEDSADGVAGLIRRRRLGRCRRDLLDPTLCHRPASAVGARWGFSDPAHFTRVFKRMYGLPPGAFRQEFGTP
jgi:AraC-like DNA-binding protein